MSKFSKFVAIVLAVAVLGVSLPAKAQTTAELQAQIQSLLAMIAQLQAQLAGGGSTGSGSYTYSVDLTIGSQGADVTALQQFLVSKGFLTMPAGASYGYFGSLTKSALAAYQASVSISPASGYFGPITRAHFNSMVGTGSPTPSGTPSVSTGPSSGMEGILTVDTNPTPASGAKYYEGDENVALLGLKVKAQNSEITVQRVKVGLGTSITAYTRTLESLSLYDGNTLLSSQALNSNTVLKEGSNYYVYFTGLNFRVNRDETRVLTIRGSFFSTIESAYNSVTLTVPALGVRGVDGAGLQQESPTTAITRTINVSDNLSESAELTVSKSANSPAAQNIVSDSQGTITEATVMALEFDAEDDLIKVDQLQLNFSGTATETAAFLYDGSTLLQSATVSSNVATFTDMEDVFQIAKDTTKTITVKVSYSGANTTAATSSVSATSTGLLAYNSEGLNVTGGNLSVSGDSDVMTIISAGPVFSLQSGVTTYQQGVQGVASSSAKGTFTISVSAEGENLYFGNESAGASSTGNMLYVYDASTSKGLVASATGSTVVTFSSAFQSQGSGIYRLAKGQSGTITITGTVLSSAVTGTNINFRLAGVTWGLASDSLTKITTLDRDVYRTSPFVTLP
jgi:hypothetical protein